MLKSVFRDNFNLFYSPFRFQKGFILPEILVIVAVIFLLTSVVMVSHRESQKRITLQRAAHKLAQDIRVAQEMAISGRECCGGGIPHGYGIFFDIITPQGNEYSYKLYADSAGSNEIYTPADERIEIIDLEAGVIIDSMKSWSPGLPEADLGKVSINFKPPDPTIKLQQAAGYPFEKVEITLALESDRTKDKTITVNTVGLIDID